MDENNINLTGFKKTGLLTLVTIISDNETRLFISCNKIFKNIAHIAQITRQALAAQASLVENKSAFKFCGNLARASCLLMNDFFTFTCVMA